MKPKRKIWYEVCDENYPETLYYHRKKKKWITLKDFNDFDGFNGAGISSFLMVRTMRQAIKHANKIYNSGGNPEIIRYIKQKSKLSYQFFYIKDKYCG